MHWRLLILTQKKKFDREHVTPYLRKKKFKRYNHVNKKDFSNIRVTLDTMNDFYLIKKIYSLIGKKFIYFNDIVQLYKKNKEIFFREYKELKKELNKK